jgi:thioredoxin 1
MATSDSLPNTNTTATIDGTNQMVFELFQEGRNAQSDIDASILASRRDGRFTIVAFGANWCPDCTALGDLLIAPKIAALIDVSYRVVSVNTGRRDKNLDLVAEYGDITSAGIPAIVILNAEGRVEIATREGELSNARTMTEAELHRWLRDVVV